ncbi:MAG: serine/threonine-protein kinase [Ramlibacter sp.]
MSLKKLGRYDLIRVLGKGAMGIVYEGRDPNLERRVAIKTVKVENLSEEAAAEYEARFRTEARSAARLQHPNIVSVYDSDRDGDIAFLVMEYIQGDDMKHHLDKGVRYSLEQSLKMIRDLLSALDYAHKQNIVHRDIKPANLLIEPGGRVKLTDFGVARMQDSGEATRTQGSMVGTLKYMSPEQVQGQKIDSRADLFSVGVVLYQLLTDKRPFDGDNDFSIIHQIIGHTPAPPSSFNARLPAAIDAVVARALAKDREQRFATARDFASALQSAIRRAEDATVVPPADPFKKAEGAGTGSKGGQSMTSTGALSAGGSTVTQEVELVYWKDIKDSTDPEELEGFLSKFPAGIYADLARRRLRKLLPGTGSPDTTILSGAIAPGGEPDLDATRMRSDSSLSIPRPVQVPPPPPSVAAGDLSTPSMPAATPPPVPVAPPLVISAPVVAAEPAAIAPAVRAGEDTDFTKTIVEPRRSVSVSSTPAGAATPPSGPKGPGVPEASVPESGQIRRSPVSPSGVPAVSSERKKLPVAVMASVAAAVVVAGIIAFTLSGGKPGDKRVASPAVAASAPVSEAVASTPVEPASTSVPVVAAVPASAAQPVAAAIMPAATPASAPAAKVAVAAAKPASAKRPVVVKAGAAPAAAPDNSRVVTATPSAPSREEPKSPPAPVAAASISPVEVCRDKVFLSREFCLAEQCDKPGTRNHPLCVKRRDEIRLREESKIRQGSQ